MRCMVYQIPGAIVARRLYEVAGALESGAD